VLTRRELIAGTAGAALAAGGIYELVERLGTTPERTASAATPRSEQHELSGLRVVESEGVEVVVLPLHHQVITARVAVAGKPAALRSAQARLDEALRSLERDLEPTPAGLGTTVAWGLPYFRRYVPELAARHIPTDRRATTSRHRPVPALLDAIRFPSDPPETILEDNDVAVLLRSDHLAHIEAAAKALFDELDVFEVTSIRKGFVGGGFDGGRSLPKRMALAAGIPGAELIPETAQLFLGFTTTHRAGLGPDRIANLETLGYTDAENGYFAGGTHLHLSHLFEDLEAWYLNFDFRERVDTTFRPGLRVRGGAETVPQGPEDVASDAGVVRDFRLRGRIGHSAAIQPTSRLARDTVGSDGTVYRKGTAVPQRADFNTLDNPFFWSSKPERDRMSDEPAAGIHFVVFNPTSDDFHRNRLAMDGVLPDGTRLPFPPRARGQGINSVLRTTHRQNFLVPPRRHRSFPLVELLPASSRAPRA
jgi:hypothetical protein